jgi:isoamylase
MSKAPVGKREVSAGSYYPLGATPSADGVNFALYSQNAREVSLLLFDDPAGDPVSVIPLENRTKFVWHARVRGLPAGQLYGYKVGGDWNPARGARFNANKLLLDPYAKALTGKLRNTDNLLLAYDAVSDARDLSFDSRDSTRIVPKCIVIDDLSFDWKGDVRPEIPLERLFIYEVHVKGFTAHSSSRVSRPGTYLGFIEKIPYLRDLGVNAVEFLPVHESYVDDFLLARGLTNYWGYNSIGFFAPESSLAAGSSPGCQVEEFKTLVRELHKAGIEVILDVVYNHTGEGSELGPTACFRGIDNQSYYSLCGAGEYPFRYYMNYTGCGNTLNLTSPPVIRLVMDSLRYWVETMHVDGFRFDLASVLGREETGFARSASFFDAISQDPLLNHVKLIAEPWDIGTYQLGNFPVDWSEWNGRFRDTARRFLKGDGGRVGDLGFRLTGSADLYGDDGRSAYNSINFITCHDGFTLNDLVSYNGKHNEANQEGNRDGSDDNASWNCGSEGETEDETILALRKQQARNALCMLLFASGTPMILGGDELLRTQVGNNNAYCQDNETSWHDWTLIEKNRDMHAFTKQLIGLCRRYPILQRRKYLTSQDSNSNSIPDIQWMGVGGGEMAWNDNDCRSIGYALDGELAEPGPAYRLFIFFNADHESRPFIPPLDVKKKLHRLIDTSLPDGQEITIEGSPLPPAASRPFTYLVNPRSTVVLVEK